MNKSKEERIQKREKLRSELHATLKAVGNKKQLLSDGSIMYLKNKCVDFLEFQTRDAEDYTYTPNHLDKNASVNGYMFETFGKELEYIKKIDKKTPRKVWTVAEYNGKEILLAGFRLVNRLGYLVSHENWQDNNEEYPIDKINI